MNAPFASSHNEGIMITGGKVQVGAAAVGPYAHAHATGLPEPRDLDVVRIQLVKIRELLAQRRDELHEPDEVIESVRVAEEELAQERPDKLRVLGLLGKVMAGVESVSGLGAALERLFTVINRLL